MLIGWLRDSGLELESATPGTKVSYTDDGSLLHASRMVAGCTVDYRFVSLAIEQVASPCYVVSNPDPPSTLQEDWG